MERREIDIKPKKKTFMAVCSSETSVTDTTKTFTGESSLTGSIVQTWAAATKILLREKNIKGTE